jgi:hypothetical protein
MVALDEDVIASRQQKSIDEKLTHVPFDCDEYPSGEAERQAFTMRDLDEPFTHRKRHPEEKRLTQLTRTNEPENPREYFVSHLNGIVAAGIGPPQHSHVVPERRQLVPELVAGSVAEECPTGRPDCYLLFSAPHRALGNHVANDTLPWQLLAEQHGHIRSMRRKLVSDQEQEPS